ncbi:MAG: radical SAM family heme chaperone HemW [Alphaproteobacteria bacterium]|nr:radical SAM family heme chaperone HemW [Alphaproteobacteria bacterium]
MNYPHNLYIHVPFCMSKCNYCAFYSHACNNPDWKKYADDICSELKFWSARLGKINIPTIFFGGGTPSLMPVDTFEQIIKCIKDNFYLMPDCEITLESNPGTIDKNKLIGFVSNGVNRLSVGIQSLKDEELVFLGRRHNVRQSLDLLTVATEMNLRVSGDFIYGFPNHNVESVIDLCKQINELGLKHVSMYELTIEENTPFGRMNLKMPDNDTMANMYIAIGENLKLPRYEVSNYAIENEQCRHNINIWDGGAYIGIGRGGAGRVWFNNTWYEQKGGHELFEKMSNETRATEKILTGLRTMRGVKLADDIKNMLNFDWIKSHKDLVEIDNEYLHTTPKGLLILDDLTLDLIK